MPTARENGWDGFNTAGSVEKVTGGHEYRCDGMPHPMGCPETVTVSRKWSRVGTKGGGWMVCYGTNDDGSDDLDIVLAFGPKCAVVVREQSSAPPPPTTQPRTPAGSTEETPS